MGKGPNQEYVCVVNRDSAYKNKYFGDHHEFNPWNSSWDYHNFRDSNIEDYTKAINYFLKKGFFVIRMGKSVEKELVINDKNFIDYSKSKFRSDFLDVFLFYNSRLNLVSESGILVASMIFRKPMCSVNFAEFAGLQTWHKKNIIIFKKYWSKKMKRFLSLKELIKLSKDSSSAKTVERRQLLYDQWRKVTSKNLYIPFNHFLRSNDNPKFIKLNKDGKVNDNSKELPMGSYGLLELQRSKDIEIFDNTPEEIMEACEELDKRISGEWIKKNETENLQKKFWDIYPTDLYSHGVIRSRIGENFLKKNNFLLDK